MVRIEINNLQDLKLLQNKLRTLKAAQPLLKESSVREVSEKILDEIKTKMSQNNFSNKIIDDTFVGKIERLGNIFRSHFISNYVSDTGFDVSKAREEGTSDHIVRPKKENGVLRWIGNANQTIFRKKSRPKGIERLLIIENTIKENQSFANEKAEEIMVGKMKKVLGV